MKCKYCTNDATKYLHGDPVCDEHDSQEKIINNENIDLEENNIWRSILTYITIAFFGIVIVAIIFSSDNSTTIDSSSTYQNSYKTIENRREEHIGKCMDSCLKYYDISKCIDIMGEISTSVNCSYNNCMDKCLK